MKRFFSLFMLFLISIPLFSQENKTIDIGFFVTTDIRYIATPCKFKDEGKTTFSIFGPSVGIGVTFLEDLTVEGKLGYSLQSFSGLTTFNKLPLELEEELNLSGFFVGFEAQYSNIYEYEDFGLSPFFTFYYGNSSKEWDINLPIVKGIAKNNTGWIKGRAGAKVLYNGLDLHTPYLGLYFTITSGTTTMKEDIEEISAKHERKFKERIPFGISIGDEFEIIEDLYINGELKFGGEFSFAVNLRYTIK